jgi:hypothetical protein
MKKLLLLTTLFSICNFTYSQVSDKITLKNKYAGVKPKMPDSTQIVAITPENLLKKRFNVVNYSSSSQVIDNNKNAIKPRFEKILPASSPSK